MQLTTSNTTHNMKLLQSWNLNRVLRYLLTVYFWVSIIYTTNEILSPLIHALLSRVGGSADYGHFFAGSVSSTLGFFGSGHDASGSDSGGNVRTEQLSALQRLNAYDFDGVIYWDSPTGRGHDGGSSSFFPKARGRPTRKAYTATSASLFLSKAFAVSEEHLADDDQSNFRILPYYYRAKTTHDKNDITITTLVTRNRFAVFKQLVERYRGPISVTIHVAQSELTTPPLTQSQSQGSPKVPPSKTKNPAGANPADAGGAKTKAKHASTQGSGSSEQAQTDFLSALHALYTSTPLMAELVDVHLVLTPRAGDRQFNTWRNVARMFARTDYVMLLDVDFVPCTDFRERVRRLALGHGGGGGGGFGKRRAGRLGGAGEESGSVRKLLRSGDAALVVPAFEYVKHEDGLDAETFPKDKESLVALYNASKITMFHASWAPGHNSTDYARFLFHSKPGEVYKVSSEAYHHAYEPYVIFRREGPGAGVPWCDERFVGYGGNKAACLYEMYMSGVSFYVLSDDFLVHQSHAYDEAARKAERRYNRKIYADFREEVCLKYLKAFLDTGKLGTPKAQNVREECKKIKGATKLAAMLVESKLGIQRGNEAL